VYKQYTSMYASVHKVLSRIGGCDYYKGFGWMIGFTDTLYTPLGTTGNTALSLFPHFTIHCYTH
jgi:hypothetical protein